MQLERLDGIIPLMGRAVKTIKIDTDEINEKGLMQAARCLSEGKIAAIPTETFYALAADPFHREAVERVQALKKGGGKEGRERKPFLLLIADQSWVPDLASERPEIFFALADRFWPGPLTLLMRSAEKIPDWIDRGTGKVGLRVTSNRISLEILKRCRFPLTGTSANPSGERPAETADEVLSYFRHRLDLLVDGGKTGGGQPSTLLDITSEPPVLLREGMIRRQEIEKLLKRELRGTR